MSHSVNHDAKLKGEGSNENRCSVVIDVSNSPSFEDAAEAAAGVTHHVALSIVGTDCSPEIGYFRAKLAQETLIKESPIPYSIVHATQFFEFIKGIADAATNGNTVRIAPVLFQPIAADDVASPVSRVAMGFGRIRCRESSLNIRLIEGERS